MASPLGKFSTHQPPSQADDSQSSLSFECLHDPSARITVVPDVPGTPGLQYQACCEYTDMGKRYAVLAPVLELDEDKPIEDDGQYHPPGTAELARNRKTYTDLFPKMAQPVMDATDEFKKQGTSHKMPCIKKITELVQPNPKDNEEETKVRAELKQYVYEWAHSVYDHLIIDYSKVLNTDYVSWELACCALLFATIAQDEQPGAACRMAINALLRGIKVKNFHHTGIPEMAMEIAAKLGSHLDISSPEERVIHVNRGTRAYTRLHGKNRDWKWQLMKSAEPTALEISAPNEKITLYWDHWKELCIFGRADCQKQNDTEKAKQYNEQGLKAFQQSGIHRSPLFNWDSCLMKLHLPMGLDYTLLTTTKGKRLYDCQHIEQLFKACAQVSYKFPAADEETLSALEAIEKSIRKTPAANADLAKVFTFAIQRLFGSPLLTKQISYAEQLFQKIPNWNSLLKAGDSNFEDRYERLIKQAQSSPGKEPDKDTLLLAKLAFLRGTEAEAEGRSKKKSQHTTKSRAQLKKAKESYLASAEGGFAGGYTGLALLTEDLKEAEVLLQAATDKGDISAWRSMADHLVSTERAKESHSFYRKALDIYNQYGFEEEASQIEELLGLDAPTPVPKKKKKKGKKADDSSQTDTTATPQPTQETSAKKANEKIVLPLATQPLLAAATIETPLPEIASNINGCMEKWVEQIAIMQRDAPLIMQNKMIADDSFCKPIELTKEATIGPFSRFCQFESIQKYPESHFHFSTWLVLRINQNDNRCTLFCNTNGLERRHAETNMMPHLKEELEIGDVKTVEILITRDPCGRNRHNEGFIGCWQVLKGIIRSNKNIQWHIRFIRPNKRHLHPQNLATQKTVNAFDATGNKPLVFSSEDKPLSLWQEQVVESRKIKNLSYSAVPTRTPKDLKAYYGVNGVTKFLPEEFKTNPHVP